MGGTALKRKARRNKTRVKARNHTLKVQGFKPVIKMVDVDAIKEEFKNNPPAKSAKTKADTAKAEAVETKTPVKAKKEATAKKPAAAKAKKTEVADKATKAEVKKTEVKKSEAKKPATKKTAPKAKKVEPKEDKA